MIKDNKIIGAVLFGDTADGTRLMQMIREETDISGMAKTSILTDSSGGGGAASGVAEMKDDAIICGCNGVTKGTICSAIKEQGLTTVDEVKNCTTASRSCGGCKPLVSDLLAFTLRCFL